MAREDNLTPFKKGNKFGKGAPRRQHTATLLKKLFAGKVTVEQAGKDIKVTKEQVIHLKQIEKALEGDTRAYNSLLDRVDGKPFQESSVDMDAKVETKDKTDYSKLSKDAKRKILALLEGKE